MKRIIVALAVSLGILAGGAHATADAQTSDRVVFRVWGSQERPERGVNIAYGGHVEHFTRGADAPWRAVLPKQAHYYDIYAWPRLYTGYVNLRCSVTMNGKTSFGHIRGYARTRPVCDAARGW